MFQCNKKLGKTIRIISKKISSLDIIIHQKTKFHGQGRNNPDWDL
jgi:hypothetical protein